MVMDVEEIPGAQKAQRLQSGTTVPNLATQIKSKQVTHQRMGRLPRCRQQLFVEEMMGLPKNWTASSFPKWRAASVKAYGNAIAPAVRLSSLEIFKAIQDME